MFGRSPIRPCHPSFTQFPQNVFCNDLGDLPSDNLSHHDQIRIWFIDSLLGATSGRQKADNFHHSSEPKLLDKLKNTVLQACAHAIRLIEFRNLEESGHGSFGLPASDWYSTELRRGGNRLPSLQRQRLS